MRDHTHCSQFYPTKCNFPKKSLDSSIPQNFPQTLLKFPIWGQIPQKWDPWVETHFSSDGYYRCVTS